MASIDLKKVYKNQYRARVGQPALVDVPERPFLMIDGKGDPGKSPEYGDAVAALYPLAYGMRAEIKKATGDAYTVLPLEGLWWADDMSSFIGGRRDEWKWTMMIGLPEAATAEMASVVLPEVIRKKRLAAGEGVRFELFAEGECAHVMHIGPYSAEAPTIAALHDFIAANGLERRGLHHEIYLGDPRKADPAKLKTIIRQPVVAL